MLWRLLILAFVVSGCGRSSVVPLDIILITIDTIRADRLGCYGYFRQTSPNLDRLASEAVVFDRCLAPMATTLPAHLSLMTATFPDEHSVLANARDAKRRFIPNPVLRTFAEIAREQGYATAAFVSATPVKSHSGLQTGFDFYDEPETAERCAEETNQAVFSWLDTAPSGPRFLWVHYFDPHSAYDPPAPFDTFFSSDPGLFRILGERRFYRGEIMQGGQTLNTASLSNLYDGEIRYLDKHLGEFIDALRSSGRWNQSVVIVAGDHGEGLGQHGEIHHGSNWHEQLHVPLIVRIPGGAARRDENLLSLVHVLPLVTSTIDWPGKEHLVAQASSRSWSSGTAYVLGQSSMAGNPDARASDVYSLTGVRWKYIVRDGHIEHLFDLIADPFELENVASTYPDTLLMLQAELLDQIEALDRNSTRFWSDRPDRPDVLSPRTIDELRALGYLK